MQTIATIDQLVSAIGGRHLIGKELGVEHDTIYMWKLRGYIPPRHLFTLTRLARAHGVKLDDALFLPPHGTAPSDENEAGTLPNAATDIKPCEHNIRGDQP